jgi:hypothetical protein
VENTSKLSVEVQTTIPALGKVFQDDQVFKDSLGYITELKIKNKEYF